MTSAELIARLSAEDPNLRLEAVARLVAAGPSAVPLLLEAARNPAVVVRVHAIQALGTLEDPRGLATVVAALGETANHGAVAIVAERALVTWGMKSCGPSVEAVALSGDPSARARAVRVLGSYRPPGGAALLVRLLGDALDTVRLQAAEALAAIDGPLARAQLPALLDDSTDFVRWGVAEALVKLGSTLAEAVLAEALADDETHDWAEELLEELAQRRRQGTLHA